MNYYLSSFADKGGKLLLIAMVLIVSGCASVPYQAVPLLSHQDVNSGKGVVVVRVIPATKQHYPFNRVDIVPKDFNESEKNKIQSISALPAKRNQSLIFAGALKPGSYMLDSILSFYFYGDYYFTNGVKAAFNFGTFSVEANKITDLGTIIYYPNSQEGVFTKTLIRVPVDEPAKLISQYFPFYQYDKSQVLTWDEDGFSDERESAYVSAVQNPVAFNHEYLADDGYLYMLAPLGVIVVRTPEGQWLTDAVDTNLAMHSIAKNAAGDLIVGGSEGRVFVKRGGSDFWEDISINEKFDVQEVAFDDANNMLVFASKETYMGVFVSQENAISLAPNWQVPLRYNSYSGFFKNDANRLQWQQLNGQNRIMNAKFDRSDGKLILVVEHQKPFLNLLEKGRILRNRYVANLNDLSFKSIKEKSKVDTFVSAGSVRLGFNSPSFWYPELRFFIKNKKTSYWNVIDTRLLLDANPREAKSKLKFMFLSAPWFSSLKNGVAIATVGMDKQPRILVSNSGGKYWKMTEYELPEEYCVNIISIITDRLLLSCDGTSGDFYESTDNGKTWQHVREHEQF